MRSILIATANPGKFNEIEGCLKGRFDRFLSLADFEERIEVIEDRATYLGNASKKARKVGNRLGINTLADDSGLEVDALDGRPGIHSARYAPSDEEKIERLLTELTGVPLERRTATFKAYLAYYLPVGWTGVDLLRQSQGLHRSPAAGRRGLWFRSDLYAARFRTITRRTEHRGEEQDQSPWPGPRGIQKVSHLGDVEPEILFTVSLQASP